ncbi:MAG: hypothetical protein ACK5MV_06170 [Aminipila sp.]
MEVNVSGTTYIVNESFGMADNEKREATIAEKLAGIIIMDKSELPEPVKTA